jgi:Fic family protein
VLFETPSLGSRELEIVSQVEGLKEQLRWQLQEPRRWVGSLRRLSFARNIQGSNSIEGYEAALDDAAAVAVGEEPLDASEETRLALAGYRDAMTFVLQLSTDPHFSYSEQLLKSLHFIMTGYDLKNRPGQWRTGSTFVQREETGELVHEGADIGRVPELMAELSTTLNGPPEGLPAIVHAGMAHLNLVMIHPFRDGNGRMARCLQSLVLARQGVLAPVFMSIEEYLGKDTTAYYDVLAEVGDGSWQPGRDARPWVRFVLTAHLRQARTVLQRVKESERLWLKLEALVAAHSISDRTITALFDAALGMRVRRATYRANVEQAGEEMSEQAATRDLKQLTDVGLLVPQGEKRGRVYVGGPDIRRLREEMFNERAARDDTDPFAG